MTTAADSERGGLPESLDGKVTIVTGAAQGLGRVTARYLAERGAAVVAVDREDCSATVADVQNAGGDAHAVRADVSNASDFEAAAAEAVDRFGQIDALINGAALFTTLQHASFLDIDPDEWDRVFQVNTKSVFLGAKAIAPHMIARRSGSIINIGSNVVTYGSLNFLHYVASKSAIVGMSRSLARELGPHNVRVNTVSPGFVTTEITGQRPEEYRKGIVAKQVLAEPILPHDIAAVLAFLASDASRMITGQDWLVNGGSQMGPA